MSGSKDTPISTFNHEQFGEIRSITDEHGEPWFVAKDIATALGYSNVNDAILRHCKGVVKHDPFKQQVSGSQPINIIPESDLYRLIMRSKLPQAEAFQDWVTSEVLPSIRKTGKYAVSEKRIYLTESVFIKHRESLWLDINTLVKVMNLQGIQCTDENFMDIIDDNINLFDGMYDKYNNSLVIKIEAVIYLALLYAGMDAIRISAAVNTIMAGFRTTTLKTVRIDTVKQFHNVLSKAQQNGHDINFISHVIRYKDKDLDYEEISKLMNTSPEVVEELILMLEDADLLDMLFFQTPPTPEIIQAAPVLEITQQVSPIDFDIQNLCRGLGIRRESLKDNNIYDPLARTHKHAIFHTLNTTQGFTSKEIATSLSMNTRDVTRTLAFISDLIKEDKALQKVLKIIEDIPMHNNAKVTDISKDTMAALNSYFKSDYKSYDQFRTNVIFDDVCRYDILRFTHKEGFYSCDTSVMSQLNFNHNVTYNSDVIGVIWKIFYS